MTTALLFQLSLVFAFVCSLHQNIMLHVDGDDNSSYAYDMRRFAHGLELGFDVSLALFLGLAVNANHYALLVVAGAAAATILTQFRLLRTNRVREAALRCFVPLATLGATVMNLEVFGKQLPVLLVGLAVGVAVSSLVHANRLRKSTSVRA